jgi:hypothetical protein
LVAAIEDDVGAQYVGRSAACSSATTHTRAADGHGRPAGGDRDGDDEVPDLFAGRMVDHEAGSTDAVDIGFSVGQLHAHEPVMWRVGEVGRQHLHRGVGPARRGLAARESLEEMSKLMPDHAG